MRFILNGLIASLVMYVWTLLGLMTPNTSLDLPYLSVQGDHKALVLLLIAGIAFQIVRVLVAFVFALGVMVTLGVGLVLLPALGAFVFIGLEHLGILELHCSFLVLCLIGMLTLMLQIPAPSASSSD